MESSFEEPNGTPLGIDSDYSGGKRSEKPNVGPFEGIEAGSAAIVVWEFHKWSLFSTGFYQSSISCPHFQR
jgi:hypothetical protein